MTKLNDTQMILLSAASQRESGSLLPLPEQLARGGARVTKALTALQKLGLAEERETSDAECVAREDGDLRFGLFVTAAGLKAIGVGDEDAGAEAPPAPAPAAKVSKSATVLTLLERSEGATLAELIAATGWLPHTTRAALTGLRKKGHSIERTKRGDETCYRTASAA